MQFLHSGAVDMKRFERWEQLLKQVLEQADKSKPIEQERGDKQDDQNRIQRTSQ